MRRPGVWSGEFVPADIGSAPVGPRADDLWARAVTLLALAHAGFPLVKHTDALFEDIELDPYAIAAAYE